VAPYYVPAPVAVTTAAVEDIVLQTLRVLKKLRFKETASKQFVTRPRRRYAHYIVFSCTKFKIHLYVFPNWSTEVGLQ